MRHALVVVLVSGLVIGAMLVGGCGKKAAEQQAAAPAQQQPQTGAPAPGPGMPPAAGPQGQAPAAAPAAPAPTATRSVVPAEPGWPDITPEQALAQYCIEEAHYHLERARILSPDTFGNSAELKLAWAYTGTALKILPKYEKPKKAEESKPAAPSMPGAPPGGAGPGMEPPGPAGPGGTGPGMGPGMGPGGGRGPMAPPGARGG